MPRRRTCSPSIGKRAAWLPTNGNERESRVEATEAKRGRQDVVNPAFERTAKQARQSLDRLFVGGFEVDRAGRPAATDGEHGDTGLNRTRGAQRMSVVRLCATHGHCSRA